MQTTARKILGDFGEALEQAVTDQTRAAGQTLKAQINPLPSTNQPTAATDSGSSEQGSTNQQQSQQQAPAQRDQFTDEFLKDIYGASDPNTQYGMSPGQKPSSYVQQHIQQGKTPEEAQQLESLRKKLHDEVYYIPLTQRKSHAQEQHEEQQEKEQEKVYEKQLEQQKKEETPLAVQMGTNRAEKFPGASG